MQFGIFDHLERRGSDLRQLYDERLRYLARVDEAGFWGFFKSEHHLTPLDMAPSPSVLMAAAAERTSRLRLIPLVYLLPFHHPLRLVEEICMLDALSGGRLEVGVGRGVAPAEHTMWGLEPELARDRSEETLAVLRRAFEVDRLDFEGRFWTFEDVPIEMKPQQLPHPPLWYPGNVEVAGSRGFNTVVGGPAAAVASQLAQYRELYEEHDAGSTGVNAGLGAPRLAGATRIYVAPSDDEARARVRDAWAAYTYNITLLWKRVGIEPSQMPLDPSLGGDIDRALEVGACVAGSPSRVAEWVAEFAEVSTADLLVSSFTWGDLTAEESMRSLDLFVEHAMTPLVAS